MLSPNRARELLWLDGDLSWKLWAQQVPIYNAIRSLPAEVDEPVILCGRQFGKSHLGVLLAVEDCLAFDDKCFLIIGPTLKQTREIVAPRLRRIAEDAPRGLIRPSKSEGKWYIGTSELVIGGMDVNSSAQRGKTVQNVYIEEIVDSRPDDYLEALRSDIGPAMTHSDAGKTIFLTTLPKVPDHPFITETMAKAELNGSLYVYTIDDNKALSATQYEACVRRAGGRNSDAFQREYLCRVIRDRSVVIIPDFDRSKDIEDFEQPRFSNLEIYTDFGGVRDMTVSLLVCYDFMRARDLVIDELWHKHNTPTDEIVGAIKHHWVDEATHRDYIYGPVTAHYVDAPGQLRVDLIRSHGYECRMPAKDDWEAAINNLAVRFTQRKVKVHPRCPLTIQTCQSGVFNKNRTDFDRSSTLGHMDAVAALMYAVRSLNRDNPYPDQSREHDGYFVKPELPVDAPNAIVPKAKLYGGGRMKRFGA